MTSSPPVVDHSKFTNRPINIVRPDNSINNSSDGSNKYKEFEHLVEKSTAATLDLVLFRMLQRLSIGTYEVESIMSGLVQAKLAKEEVYERRHSLGDESTWCWRDVSIINKLLDYKVNELKKFECVVKRKLLQKALVESYHIGVSAYRKVRRKLEQYGNMLWTRGLDKQNNKVEHLLLRWNDCSKQEDCSSPSNNIS